MRARSCAHPAPPPPGVPTAGGPGRASALNRPVPADGPALHRETTRGEHQVPDQAERDEREAPLAQQVGQVSLKTAVRAFREAAASGDKDAAVEALRAASRKLDKAVSKGVIHKNQAANRKSAMAKLASSS